MKSVPWWNLSVLCYPGREDIERNPFFCSESLSIFTLSIFNGLPSRSRGHQSRSTEQLDVWQKLKYRIGTLYLNIIAFFRHTLKWWKRMNNTSVQYKHDKLVLTPRMRWKPAGEFPQDRLIKTFLNPYVNNMRTIASSVSFSWKEFIQQSLEWSWINLTFFQWNDFSFNCFSHCSVRSDTIFEILTRRKLLKYNRGLCRH